MTQKTHIILHPTNHPTFSLSLFLVGDGPITTEHTRASLGDDTLFTWGPEGCLAVHEGYVVQSYSFISLAAEP